MFHGSSLRREPCVRRGGRGKGWPLGYSPPEGGRVSPAALGTRHILGENKGPTAAEAPLPASSSLGCSRARARRKESMRLKALSFNTKGPTPESDQPPARVPGSVWTLRVEGRRASLEPARPADHSCRLEKRAANKGTEAQAGLPLPRPTAGRGLAHHPACLAPSFRP